ncbi:MAG TPA: NAD-dependent epimerase/dehydratase family protein [Longimicrobiaceae bacterium]|jgi:nucleoside-diphosphate-sugar epimerase
MRVLLAGATGYVGSAAAEALRAAGHEVLGLARSDEAAARLEAAGLAARRGDLARPESAAGAVAEADAVIHAAALVGDADAAATEAMLRMLEGTGKAFVYTSGAWVLGSTGDAVAHEDAPANAAELVAWRPAVERAVLSAAERGVRSVVLRPTVVYGRGGGTPASLVRSARKKGVVRYVGDGAQRWPLVHVDDLAELYVLALGAPPGTLLNASAGPSVPARELAEAAAAANGARAEPWPLEAARATLGAYADALALDQQVSAERARRLLGWEPRRPDVLWELREGSYVADQDGAGSGR